MLRHVFQEYGATVELAASVMEALEYLNETVHDVIISDIECLIWMAINFFPLFHQLFGYSV
jgi:hypothetical protein